MKYEAIVEKLREYKPVVGADVSDRFEEQVMLATQQLAAADFVVLNKRDLLTERQMRRVEKFVRRRNRRALVLPTEFGRVSTDMLFATGVRRFRDTAAAPGGSPAEQQSSHLHEDAIQAFTYECSAPLHRGRFRGAGQSARRQAPEGQIQQVRQFGRVDIANQAD